MEIYKCIETFKVLTFSQQQGLWNGSIKEGTNWELVREPIPTKKMYKLKEIPNKNYELMLLYLRKSDFIKYFKKIEDNQEKNII